MHPRKNGSVASAGQTRPIARRALKARPERDALDQYFNELKDLPLLSAKQELALGREIEELEVERWRALLSFPRALDRIAAVLLPLLPQRASKLDALLKLGRVCRDPRRSRALTDATKQLHALDTERSAVSAVEAAVREAFAADRRAHEYLARVARARDAAQRAKKRFVASNLRLVISMARRYAPNLLPLADLIQEGNLGLIRAVDRFDYRRGFRFSTYAAWWIRHSFNRALSDKARLVRVPVHALDDLSRVARASERIAVKTGAIPNVAELAKQTGISEEKLELLKTAPLMKHPLSLDRSLSDEREQTLYDLLPGSEEPDPEQRLDLASQCEDLERRLACLTSIEASVLRFRFGLLDGEELTLREVGDKYNLSRERIRQLQEQALRKLRNAMRDELQARPANDNFAA